MIKKKIKLFILSTFFLVGLLSVTSCGKEKINKDVQYLNDCIEALDRSEITSKTYIEELVNKYNALSDSDKAKVKDYEKLAAKRDQIALQETLKAAQEQAEKDEKERKEKQENERKNKEIQEKNDFIDILTYVRKAEAEYDKFFAYFENVADRSQLVIYSQNNYGYMNNVRDNLNYAIDKCGSNSNFSNIKKLLNTALSDVPSSIYGENQVDNYLDYLRVFTTDIFNIDLELINLANKYGVKIE